jgi:hypothetical protein
MKPTPISITIPLIFSRAIFESAGFLFGALIGINVGFIIAYIYLIFPWGVP